VLAAHGFFPRVREQRQGLFANDPAAKLSSGISAILPLRLIQNSGVYLKATKNLVERSDCAKFGRQHQQQAPAMQTKAQTHVASVGHSSSNQWKPDHLTSMLGR
jgi:hypothetical protein